LEQVPCEEFYEKMAAILNKMAAISCVDKKTGHFENKMAAIALKFVA
jgi:hypothetical protein